MTSDTRDAFLQLSAQKALVFLFQAQGQKSQASQLRRRQAGESWKAATEAEPPRARSYGVSWVWWHGGSIQCPKTEFTSTLESLAQLPKYSLHRLASDSDKTILQHQLLIINISLDLQDPIHRSVSVQLMLPF